MAKKDLIETTKVPVGINVSLEGDKVAIKGPKGTVEKTFDNPSVEVKLDAGELKFTVGACSRKDKAVVHSYKAHMRNAFLGVKEGYQYVLKICSGHFPMNVSVSNNVLIIKNFLGEKVPRTVTLKKGVTVKVEGSTITVDGVDKDLAGQVAADIELATRRPGFDRRIFQDGIYIVEKAGKKI